ncbi:hypothetical protein GCM10009007_12880 [Formosimonas limnophila]|uniref:Uncharacterized protein n=1 Tax=Formosimonas limnophila TaxID=1384487 RepID=A0A8J3FZZ1_9BURK|nr:hypothetical protein GCM10009007_12880 [Formosimonas limnophila]
MANCVKNFSSSILLRLKKTDKAVEKNQKIVAVNCEFDQISKANKIEIDVMQ